MQPLGPPLKSYDQLELYPMPNGRVGVFNPETGTATTYSFEKKRRDSWVYMQNASCAAYSRNKLAIVVGGADGVRFSEPERKDSSFEIKAEVTAVALSNDASLMAFGRPNGAVEVWKTNPQRKIASLKASREDTVSLLRFSNSGGQLAGITGERLDYWYLGGERPLIQKRGQALGSERKVKFVDFTSDDRKIVFETLDGQIGFFSWPPSCGTSGLEISLPSRCRNTLWQLVKPMALFGFSIAKRCARSALSNFEKAESRPSRSCRRQIASSRCVTMTRSSPSTFLRASSVTYSAQRVFCDVENLGKRAVSIG